MTVSGRPEQERPTRDRSEPHPPTSSATRCWLNCWLTGSTAGGRLRTLTGGITPF